MKRGLCVVWLTWLMGLCLLSAADEVTLESAGARAVFDRARNGILTDFGLLSRDGRLASLLHSVQPVFHYADPEFGVCWAHLGGPEKEFGRIHPERAFKVEAMGLQGREWRVVAVDHYVRVEQRSQFVEGTPGVELRYHLDTLRDMQQSSWCTLASLRFRNTAYERFFPTHRVEGGVIRPVTLKIENVPFLNVVEMRHWFVVRDGATNEGLLVLFPGLTGRAFIQNDMSYLSVTGPYTEDKFAPKGETCDYTVWLVPFRGEFQATLQAWSQRLRFDASPSVQPAVSPTGAALAETDEVLVWHEVPSRKALGQEAPPPRKAAGVRLAAAQGEYEPFQLVIRGKEQMPYTRLE
ncbi:MAG: hypothetical protein FJ279_33895, partial [Planctomycetes bacterium]|nr:hypothetical protein [Planctomycetota bacterium]